MTQDASNTQESTAPKTAQLCTTERATEPVAANQSESKTKSTTNPDDYKYPIPAPPAYVKEVELAVDAAPPAVFSEQARPRGRKSKASASIAEEIGDTEGGEETGESKDRSKRKALPKTKAAAKPKFGKPKAKARAKAKQTKKPQENKRNETKKPQENKRKQTGKNNKAKQKPKTARAIRMAATDDGKTLPKSPKPTKLPFDDAVLAPPHLKDNNVYSNSYRKALKDNGGDLEEAKIIARKASALFREYGAVRSAWTGSFRPPKKVS